MSNSVDNVNKNNIRNYQIYPKFEILLSNRHWISEDEESDFCLHGDIRVKFQDKVVIEVEECTVSSSALYLLKSIKDNHLFSEEKYMFPHCGNMIVVNEESKELDTIGCDIGIDMEVKHIREMVELKTVNGDFLRIYADEYIYVVRKFAREVIEFYNQSKPKVIEDEYNNKMFTKFWDYINLKLNYSYNDYLDEMYDFLITELQLEGKVTLNKSGDEYYQINIEFNEYFSIQMILEDGILEWTVCYNYSSYHMHFYYGSVMQFLTALVNEEVFYVEKDKKQSKKFPSIKRFEIDKLDRCLKKYSRNKKIKIYSALKIYKRV